MQNKFKKGDLVRALDEQLEGYISKVINADRVEVMDASGMPFPFLSKQLVLIEAKVSLQEGKSSPSVTSSFTQMYQQNFYLFLCQEQKAKHSIYLFNNTNQSYLGTLRLKKQGDWMIVFAGDLPKNTLIFVGDLLENDLGDFKELCLQAIATKYALKNIPVCVQKIVKIVPKNILMQKECRKISELNKVGFVFEFHTAQKIALWEDLELAALKKQNNKPSVKLSNEEVFDGYEIDLHIDTFFKNYQQLNNAEILTMQLERAERFINHAKLNRYQQITIIHGKGKGVLKQEVQKLIKEVYDLKFKEEPKSLGGATIVFL